MKNEFIFMSFIFSIKHNQKKKILKKLCRTVHAGRVYAERDGTD